MRFWLSCAITMQRNDKTLRLSFRLYCSHPPAESPAGHYRILQRSNANASAKAIQITLEGILAGVQHSQNVETLACCLFQIPSFYCSWCFFFINLHRNESTSTIKRMLNKYNVSPVRRMRTWSWVESMWSTGNKILLSLNKFSLVCSFVFLLFPHFIMLILMSYLCLNKPIPRLLADAA